MLPTSLTQAYVRTTVGAPLSQNGGKFSFLATFDMPALTHFLREEALSRPDA